MRLGIPAINESLLMTCASNEHSDRRRRGCLMGDGCSSLRRLKKRNAVGGNLT